MKGYTNITEIKNYTLTNIDETFQSQVERWIEAVENYIDMMTGRNFIADSVAVERRFDGDGTRVLITDDFISTSPIVKVGKDGTPIEIESDDEPFVLYPANAQLKNPKVPFTRIELVSDIFLKGKQNIYVTAKWGYSASVPSAIKFATTVLVAGIMNFSNTTDGEVQQMTIGRYSVTYKTKKEWQDFEEVKAILEQYKKYDIV